MCINCKYLKMVGCELPKYFCTKIELIIPFPERQFCEEEMKDAE